MQKCWVAVGFLLVLRGDLTKVLCGFIISNYIVEISLF